MSTVAARAFAGELEIGRVNMGPVDRSMGVYGGILIPTAGYAIVEGALRTISRVFLEDPVDSEALRKAYAERDALRIRVVSDSGQEFHPEVVHVLDPRDVLPDDDVTLELLALPSDEAEDAFGNTQTFGS